MSVRDRPPSAPRSLHDLLRGLRHAITTAEATVCQARGDERSRVRALALMWAAHDELEMQCSTTAPAVEEPPVASRIAAAGR